MNKRFAFLLSATTAALVLGGCASGVKMNKAPVENQTAASTAGQGAQSEVAPVQATTETAALGPAANVPRSVYFAFNSYVVEDKYRPVLEGNAAYLTSHQSAHVQLQGNTDARGSREYNLALGQKRADAVMKGLEVLGVPASELEAVSFGKEKPKATGTTDADYAENRRVDFFYKQ